MVELVVLAAVPVDEEAECSCVDRVGDAAEAEVDDRWRLEETVAVPVPVPVEEAEPGGVDPVDGLDEAEAVLPASAVVDVTGVETVVELGCDVVPFVGPLVTMVMATVPSVEATVELTVAVVVPSVDELGLAETMAVVLSAAVAAVLAVVVTAAVRVSGFVAGVAREAVVRSAVAMVTVAAGVVVLPPAPGLRVTMVAAPPPISPCASMLVGQPASRQRTAHITRRAVPGRPDASRASCLAAMAPPALWLCSRMLSRLNVHCRFTTVVDMECPSGTPH